MNKELMTRDDGGFVKQERKTRRFSLKKILPRTLFGRSLMILTVPVILIQIFTAYMFFDRHWSKVTTRLAYAVAGEIAVVTNAVEESRLRQEALFKGVQDKLGLKVDYQPDGSFDSVREANNSIVWESQVAQILSGELRGQISQDFIVRTDFEEKWVRVDIDLSPGLLRVELPRGRLFSSSGYIFLLWGVGSSILLVGIAVIFMRNQIRPIRKLAAAAKRLGKGRDVPHFKPEGAREVRQAAQAFMDMHRRIKRQVSQRTAMLAGVSHDLRTPLTRLKLGLAFVDEKDAGDMRRDIEEMERMIDGYLDFVRGDEREATQVTDLNALFEKLIHDAQRQDIIVHQDLQEKMGGLIRPLAFERCLSNVIGNAAKFGDNIWVSAFIDEARKLTVAIEDDGPGIPEEDYEEVFKPFYRRDESRNIDTGGVGLGLSIAMDVVHAHGGKIWLEGSAHGGLKVNIRMPV